MRAQVIFDKLLYDVDRSVTFYLIGTNSESERDWRIRAAATARVFEAAFRISGKKGYVEGAVAEAIKNDHHLGQVATRIEEQLRIEVTRRNGTSH